MLKNVVFVVIAKVFEGSSWKDVIGLHRRGAVRKGSWQEQGVHNAAGLQVTATCHSEK